MIIVIKKYIIKKENKKRMKLFEPVIYRGIDTNYLGTYYYNAITIMQLGGLGCLE